MGEGALELLLFFLRFFEDERLLFMEVRIPLLIDGAKISTKELLNIFLELMSRKTMRLIFMAIQSSNYTYLLKYPGKLIIYLMAQKELKI